MLVDRLVPWSEATTSARSGMASACSSPLNASSAQLDSSLRLPLPAWNSSSYDGLETIRGASSGAPRVGRGGGPPSRLIFSRARFCLVFADIETSDPKTDGWSEASPTTARTELSNSLGVGRLPLTVSVSDETLRVDWLLSLLGTAAFARRSVCLTRSRSQLLFLGLPTSASDGEAVGRLAWIRLVLMGTAS